MRKSRNGFIYKGIINKFCKYCGREFESLKKTTIFCSITCANKSREKIKLERNCILCGDIMKYKNIASLCNAKRRKTICGSCAKKGKRNPFYEKNHTNEYKKNMRLFTIKKIKQRNGQISPGYNPNAIPIIEAEAKKYGITDLQHAENGGEYHIKELGYWADGYSLSKNIVIEYYELRHKYKQEKDKIREKQIKECLGCEFIIIKEREK